MIELGIKDIYFDDIITGKKTVEGRIFKERFSELKKGDTVIFYKDLEDGTRTEEKISVKVKDIHNFNDVLSMFKGMKLKSILPRSKTYKDGEKIYNEIYGNQLKNAKMIAFSFELSDNVNDDNTNNNIILNNTNNINEINDINIISSIS